MMKKIALLFAMMLFAVVVHAASYPLSLDAKIEQRWNKLEFAEEKGTKQFESDVVATLVPSLELRQAVYLFGSFGYPIRTQRPEYAIGLEFRLYSSEE